MKNLNDISIFNYSIDNHKTFDIIERSTKTNRIIKIIKLLKLLKLLKM